MKYIFTFLIIIGLLSGGYYFLNIKNSTQTDSIPFENQDNVISYISKNISTLSPQKEVLGGTFYVTNIISDRGSGTVDYEDGHNAYSANFTYAFYEKGEVEITSFVIIE